MYAVHCATPVSAQIQTWYLETEDKIFSLAAVAAYRIRGSLCMIKSCSTCNVYMFSCPSKTSCVRCRRIRNGSKYTC